MGIVVKCQILYRYTNVTLLCTWGACLVNSCFVRQCTFWSTTSNSSRNAKPVITKFCPQDEKLRTLIGNDAEFHWGTIQCIDRSSLKSEALLLMAGVFRVCGKVGYSSRRYCSVINFLADRAQLVWSFLQGSVCNGQHLKNSRLQHWKHPSVPYIQWYLTPWTLSGYLQEPPTFMSIGRLETFDLHDSSVSCPRAWINVSPRLVSQIAISKFWLVEKTPFHESGPKVILVDQPILQLGVKHYILSFKHFPFFLPSFWIQLGSLLQLCTNWMTTGSITLSNWGYTLCSTSTVTSHSQKPIQQRKKRQILLHVLVSYRKREYWSTGLRNRNLFQSLLEHMSRHKMMADLVVERPVR